MQHLAHWDDVEPARREAGHIGGTWRDLGTAVSTTGVGVALVEIDPGRWSTPAHVEGASEEIFYVLGGSGLSWQNGEVYEVREGDCLVHLPHREAHTLRAGPAGLRVLAYGHRVRHGNTILPRAGIAWMYPGFADVSLVGPGEGPYFREAAAGEPEVSEPAPRPASIAHVETLEVEKTEHGVSSFVERFLGDAVGSVRTGIIHMTIAAGRESWPPHCHSAEEEIFIVLGGEGTLVLGDDDHPIRPGHVVGRPPGTGVAHTFRAGASDLALLVYGTREPNDICWYPRSQKVSLRGVGVIGRIEPAGYWDGEP